MEKNMILFVKTLFKDVIDLGNNESLIKKIEFCIKLNFKEFSEMRKLVEMYNSN